MLSTPTLPSPASGRKRGREGWGQANADGVLLEAQDDVAAEESLGSMPSPAFARAGPPPSRGQALEPVNRLAVALAVGVVHRGEQAGRPGQLELDDGHSEAGMTLEEPEKIRSHSDSAGWNAFHRVAPALERILVDHGT